MFNNSRRLFSSYNWVAHKVGYGSLVHSNNQIEEPIEHVVHGSNGLYEINHIKKKNISVKDYLEMATRAGKVTEPEHWSQMELKRKVIYGVDQDGSLFDCETYFNFSKLGLKKRT